MARPRKKKRTQPVPKAEVQKAATTNRRDAAAPKSMVVRIGAGEVGSSVTQLVKDVRSMMEPGTASRLKERKANRLKDYTTMAGPLGVTHLLLFSRSSSGNTNLRLALTPRGPTLHFKVERYSLCKDVRRALKHPKGGEREHQTPPLLVMNNFFTNTDENKNGSGDDTNKAPKHLESLTTTVFQSLFPAIAPQSTPLSSIRRVLLLNREIPSNTATDGGNSTPSNDVGTYTINLRHYAISTKATGLSRGIRKLRAAERIGTSRSDRSSRSVRAMPDLGRLRDVSEYLLDPTAGGFTSGSDSEVETDAEVEVLAPATTRVLNRRKFEQQKQQQEQKGSANDGPVATDEASRGGRNSGTVEKRAVKLIELGPRLRLRMTKVEEGVCEGRVMWHEWVRKTRAEEQALEARWTERRRIKAERKAKQRADVERKKKAKKESSGESGEAEGGHNDHMELDDDDDDDSGDEDGLSGADEVWESEAED